jgi:hypothetical protein
MEENAEGEGFDMVVMVNGRDEETREMKRWVRVTVSHIRACSTATASASGRKHVTSHADYTPRQMADGQGGWLSFDRINRIDRL